MIVEVREGEVIDAQTNNVLENVANTHFRNKPFVYITHRIHSYAVNPSVYESTSKIENLIGFCVVSSNFIAKSNTKIEKLFLQKPFGVFDTLAEAIEWANGLLKQP